MKNNTVINDIIKNPEKINIPATLYNYGIEMEEIPASLYHNREVAMYYCQEDIHRLRDFTFFQDDEDFISTLIEADPFIAALALRYASRRIQALDYMVEKACIPAGEALCYAHPKFYKDEKMVRIAFGSGNRFNNNDWQKVDSRLRLDKKFIYSLLCKNPNLYRELSPDLQQEEILIDKIMENKCYEMLPENQKKKKSLMLRACRNSGVSIKHFPKEALNDEEFMRGVLKKYPGAIHLCGPHIKNSYEIAQEVCDKSISPPAYGFFSQNIKSDKKIALTALKINPENAKDMPLALTESEDFLKLCMNSGVKVEALAYFSPILKGDYRVMKEIVSNNIQCAQYMGDNIKYCVEVMRDLVESFKSDDKKYETIVKELFISLNLKYDRDICIVFADVLEPLLEKYQMCHMFKSFSHEYPGLCDSSTIEEILESMRMSQKLETSLHHKNNHIKIKI